MNEPKLAESKWVIPITVAEFNLERVIDFVKFAESKATVVITLAGAFVAGAVTQIPAATRVVARCFSSHLYSVGSLVIIAHSAFYVLVAFALYYALKVVRPKLRRESGKHSWYFFESIGLLTTEDYEKFCGELDEAKLLSQLCDQIYNNAKVARRKFGEVRCALILLTVAGAVGLLTVIPVLIIDTLK